MIPPAILIGPFTLHTYGLIFAAAILAGWILARKRAHLYKIPKQLFDEPIFLVPLILGIAGARIYHVLDYWHEYSSDFTSIFNLSGGGLGIWGGLIGAFFGLFIVARVKKLKYLFFLDLLAPSFLLGQSLGRFGNYVNQEAFGPPTNLPWGVYIKPGNRPAEFLEFERFHPTFFYEAAIDFILFLILVWFSSRQKKPGQTFALYLVFYAIGRFAVEFFRIDTWKVGNLKIAYIFSIVTIFVGLVLLYKKNPKVRKS
jgi:phosphatidylglycerol:prolipoprotein diacylglycerol transferase